MHQGLAYDVLICFLITVSSDRIYILIHIVEVFAVLTGFWQFSQLLQESAGNIPRSGHDCFLKTPSEPIINQSISHALQCSLHTDIGVKLCIFVFPDHVCYIAFTPW
jgi:hypothetical protein